MIPPFLSNGQLPEGLHSAPESEVLGRFSAVTLERKVLGRTVSRWIRICRSAGAMRFCLDGSFVTASLAPHDVDAVVWLGAGFSDRVAVGDAHACELAVILSGQTDEYLFAAGNQRDWDDWVEFFSRTRDPDIRKGLVEIML